MAGPWEKYGPPVESGPWDKYKSGPAQVDAGGKTFEFENVEDAAGFQRSMTGSAVSPDQMAIQYAGRAAPEPIPAARQPAVGGIRRGFSGGAQNRAVTRAAASSVVAPFASAADTTLGSIAPGFVQQVGYPFARAFGQTPEEATATVGRFSAPIERPFGRAFGVTETPEYKGEASQRLTQFIGEGVNKAARAAAEQTGLPEQDITNIIGSASLLAGPTVAKIPTKLGERQADKAIAASNKSFEDLPRIEAKRKASKYGILISPNQSNPGKINAAVDIMSGGRNADEFYAKQNAPKWTTIAKKDMGLPPNTILDEKGFEKAREVHAKPYDVIQEIGPVKVDGEFLTALKDIQPTQIIGSVKRPVVDKMLADASQITNTTGKDILESIKTNRKEADKIYRQQNATAEDRAVADAHRSIANALEDLAARNINDSKFKDKFQTARAEMAKIYAYEDATDFASKRIDPQKIVKLVESDPQRYTGVIRDLADIAANFPSASQIQGPKSGVAPRLLYSTPSVALGGLLGTALGGDATTGALIGAGLGTLGGRLVRRGAASSPYQNFMGTPTDNRLRVDMPEQEAVTNNLLTAPLPAEPQLSPKQRRAFEMAREEMARPPPPPPPAPPTTGGVELQFDPFTNKLRPVEPTGAPLPPQNELAIAVGKISRGERATLSATEKIAFDKARVDLTIADPAYRSLSPDQVANRMSDRKSVEATIQKAREKAAGFDEIARRAKDRDAIMLANANRERMLDFAEDLEDRLRAMPAVKLGQGPKTRAAKTLPPVVITAKRLPPEE